MYNKLLISILCFFCFNQLIAQKQISFEHISTQDGLSQSDVNSIFQDKKGFMWFGTHDGLNRYDGYKFTVFKPDPNKKNSINSNLIWSIVGDQKDNLWVGTTGYGLNYFDRTVNEFKHFTHNSKDSESLIDNHVNTLYVDSKNRLWVGTIRGIDLLDENFDGEKAVFRHIEFNEGKEFSDVLSTSIYAFYEDSKNQIWVASTIGLSKLERDKNGDLFFHYMSDIIGLPEDLPVRSLSEDSFGNLLIGTSNGLYRFSKHNDSGKLELIRYGVYNAIKLSGAKIWAGTNNGLLQFGVNSNSKNIALENSYGYDPVKPNLSLSKNIVKSLFVDNTGIVWVGSNAGGINKLDPNQKEFKRVQQSLNSTGLTNNSIKAIFEDSNGTLWVGNEEGGLNYVLNNAVDKRNLNFKKILTNESPVEIVEIVEQGRKKLLVGASNAAGLYKIDISNTKKGYNNLEVFQDISKSIFSILQDKDKNLWLGTYNGGVYRWVLSKDGESYKKDVLLHNKLDSLSLSNNIIRDIHQDEEGNIWFATANGLSRLSPDEALKRNPKFDNYKNKSRDTTSLSNNYILSIFERKNGELWVGTFGGGLNKLFFNEDLKSYTFKSYSTKNGMPNDVVKGILEDKNGNLWVSSNGGLTKFNPKEETIKNFDVNDGLQSNEFGELACFKRNNGEMIFGGVEGMNFFFPEKITENEINAETVFTNFSIFNEPVGINEKINGRVILNKSIDEIEELSLKYAENSFSVEFAALHYAASRKNKYAYKLEGFDHNWLNTTSDNRYATYTNLEPGNYVLKVKASNNDGVWDATPAQLKINVIPPFWRTNWAKMIYLLLLFGMLVAFRRFTVIRTTKKHQLELEHFEKEKNEEMQRLKLEFFTNISHEFRTPLTLIRGPLEYLQKNIGIISQNEVQEQYNIMHNNTNYLMRLINQLLDFRKMDKGVMKLKVGKSNIEDFLHLVGEPFQFLSQKKGVEFEIKSTLEDPMVWFDPDAIEKIVNNLLSNAFKFTPKGGSVIIEIANGENVEKGAQTELSSNENECFVITVKDTGAGIPKHRINFIFDRYYVDNGVRKINSQGTGIGLSFTKDLVVLHKGNIEVESVQDEGTTFNVWIPKDDFSYENQDEILFYSETESSTFINQLNAESHAVGVLDEIVDKSITKTRSKLPVLLVVDDNQDIRTLVKRGLGESYDVYEAENGERGFEMANKLMPNVIVTDILMPIMDGIEFCDKIKTTQETSHIPVLMLTAKTSHEWEVEGLRTGADAYIKKPFDMEVLNLTITNILKRREELRKRFNREITLQPNEVTITSTDETFLNKAIEIVEKNMMNTEFSVEQLVKEMSLSRSNLYLKIKELTGLSSSEFIRNIRLKRAVQLIEKSDLSVKEIMYMTGFNTASYFSKCFKKQFGVIPSKYVRQNASKSQETEL